MVSHLLHESTAEHIGNAAAAHTAFLLLAKRAVTAQDVAQRVALSDTAAKVAERFSASLVRIAERMVAEREPFIETNGVQAWLRHRDGTPYASLWRNGKELTV